MLTRDEARELVSRLYCGEMLKDDELVVADEFTIERPWGWLFCRSSRRFLETRDLRHAAPGNAPVLVEKESGRMRLAGTGRPVQFYIDNYERTGDPLGERAPDPAGGAVSLAPVERRHIPVFFEHQLDAEALRMSAFFARDVKAFVAHWLKNLADPTNVTRTILAGDRVAGYAAKFERAGEPEVCYWLGREFWGKGIATAALAELLKLVPVRPLHARVAKRNPGSVRVLEKCGFVVTGEDRYANAAGETVDEFVLKLAA